MRLKKEFIEKISKKIIKSLSSKDLIIWEGDHSRLESIISNIIIQWTERIKNSISISFR